MTEPLDFTPRFPLPEPHTRAEASAALDEPDRRDGAAYDLLPSLHLAVEVALVTGRPLLLRGDPGSGKSALAPYVARRLNWRYYEQVVTSQTEASDLLWRHDAIRRLADAQVPGRLRPDHDYIDPGVLWWAFDRESALHRGVPSGAEIPEPYTELNAGRHPQHAVVLIDEIDKAHPDVPNGLLIALGSRRFEVPYLPDPVVRAAPPGDLELGTPLVIVTTNEERDLPAAFVRRCVTHRLDHPKPTRLVEIARRHFDTAAQPMTDADETLALAVALRVEALREGAAPGVRRPSTAEFLDAYRACRAYGVTPDPGDATWRLVEQLTLAKPDAEPW